MTTATESFATFSIDHPLLFLVACIITLVIIFLSSSIFCKKKHIAAAPNTKNTKILAFILEIEGTLLQQVDNMHADSPGVQQLSYATTTSTTTTTTTTCSVLVRPSLEKAITKLITEHPECELLLTPSTASTSKEFAEATCQQLRVGGATLSTLGFRVVPIHIAQSRAHNLKSKRNVAVIRKWAGLDDLCLCIVVSNVSKNKILTSGSDHLVSAPDFGRPAADTLLRTRKTSARIEKQWHAGETKMIESIFSATYVQPHLGVSLEFFRAFRKHHMKGCDKDFTTTQVCDEIIKKKWCSANSAFAPFSFAELVQQGKIPHMTSDMVGIATHFVSHAWAYEFDRTAESLEEKYGSSSSSSSSHSSSSHSSSSHSSSSSNSSSKDTPPQYFWVDLFSVPQTYATPVVPPSAWWATTFFHSIAARPNFVLIWYTWRKPVCCDRAWCIWEIYGALHSGRNVEDGTLDIIMPADQLQEYQNTLLSEDIHIVANSVTQLDAGKASAWPLHAKDMIFQQVENHQFGIYGIGFNGLNGTLKTMLYNWVVYSGRVMCNEMEEAGPPTSKQEAEKRGILCHSIAKISHQRTNYVDAETQFRRAVAVREQWLGSEHPDTLESIHRLGCTIIKHQHRDHHPDQHDHDRQDEGIALFKKVATCNTVSSVNRLRAQKMLARAMMNKGQFSEGVDLLRVCWREMIDEKFGTAGGGGGKEEHKEQKRAELLKAKNGGMRSVLHLEKLLGTGLREIGEYDEALELHERMTREWGELDGTSHDNYLAAMSELATTLDTMGKTEESCKKMEYVVRRRILEDGMTHRKTRTAQELLARLRTQSK